MTSQTLLKSILLGSAAVLFATTGDSAWADSSHARVIRVSLVQGHVRFTRDYKGDPLADQKAVWEDALLNLPIRQDYALATDEDGRAEVEFENGAMAFLAENTVLEFYDLSLNDGGKTTRLVLRQGTASFYVNPASEDYFSVTGGDFTVEAASRANFRLDNFDDGSVVNVSKGHISVLHKKKTTLLAKGQSLSMRAGDDSSLTVGQAPAEDDFDRWVSGREDNVQAAINAAQPYINSPYYTSGIADLYTYGSWYPVGGYGNCWRPYGVGYGWSPFDNGGWFNDPWFGWGFIGYQPWGWLPYHYGGWIFDPGFGWLWSPGLGFGGGFGYGFTPYRPVTGIFVHTRTGLLGIVPTHPFDVHGKTPVNLTRGVFPVTGGKTSALVAANGTENWKTMKAPPRDAFVSRVTAAAAPPARVSRSIVTASVLPRNAGTNQRTSSIVYDPAERRFVNANSSAASSVHATEGKTEVPQRNGTAVGRAVSSGVPTASRTTAANLPPISRGASARASVPSAPRNMTPPPAPRSYGGGGGGGAGSSWGGGAASGGSRGSSMPAASAPAPHASAPAAGGRPH
jgi:FecR protein